MMDDKTKDAIASILLSLMPRKAVDEHLTSYINKVFHSARYTVTEAEAFFGATIQGLVIDRLVITDEDLTKENALKYLQKIYDDFMAIHKEIIEKSLVKARAEKDKALSGLCDCEACIDTKNKILKSREAKAKSN